jgi:hypothetical protein
MKLSIIVPDAAVYKDGVGTFPLTWQGTPDDVHALQWYDVVGNIEYVGERLNEEITELPVWAQNALAAWEEANAPKPPPVPTAAANGAKAASLLRATDWVNEPDVYDPLVNPHLMNREEFLVYRSQIRDIAIDPPAGDLVWPPMPTPVWSAA